MQIITSIKQVRQIIKAERQKGNSIGLIPTMGNLHKGHMSLVEQIAPHANIIITSIFVNPLQFGENEDFGAYPKTLESDAKQLAAAGCHYVFAPNAQEMYPDGNKSKSLVSVTPLDNILCGKSRPGHLTGVATVVAKFFNIIMPDFAIFGLKDYQQFLVIQQMIKDLCFPVEIIGAPIVRNDQGLALSSRNGYLSAEELEIAPRLNQILNIIKQSIIDGETNYKGIENQTQLIINESGFKADYFEIRTQDNLQLATKADKKLAIFIAAHLGKARLIDNVRFELS